MCGRFTYKLTWEELMRLYRLTLDQPARNTQARYNVCPTDPIDTIVESDGKRELVTMRWGLVPRWWSKTLKDVKMATFNARAETVETKPFFRDAFKRTRCLIPVSGYYEWQDTPAGKQPWYFTARDGSPALEADELLVTMALHAAADDLAFEHVESGKQCRCAVTLIVVGHCSSAALLHRQARLGAIQRLDLRLLVDRENDGMGGWIDIEPDDVTQLVFPGDFAAHRGTTTAPTTRASVRRSMVRPS
jgi:hypothetical protein